MMRGRWHVMTTACLQHAWHISQWRMHKFWLESWGTLSKRKSTLIGWVVNHKQNGIAVVRYNDGRPLSA